MRLILTTSILAALAAAQTPSWQTLLQQRNWTQAEPLLRAELESGGSAPVLHGLATLYRATGRLADADPILERLIALEETVPAVEELARIKLALGRPELAEALYRRSLELRIAASEDEIESIPTRQRLAEVLASVSRFPEAEQTASDALVIRLRRAGPADPDVAADTAVLARIYQTQRKSLDAIRAWESVLRVQEAAHSIDDARLAPTLDSIAALRQNLMQLPEAEQALRRALAIRQATRGPSTPDVAQTIDALGQVLFLQQRFPEAEPLFTRSLAIWTSILGEDSALLALNYDNLAVTKASLGKYDEAEDLYLRALRLRDSDDIASLSNLAVVRGAQERYAEAEPLYRRAIDMAGEPHNERPGRLADLLTDYADLLRNLGREPDATRIERRVQQITKGAPAPKGSKAPPVATKAK